MDIVSILIALIIIYVGIVSLLALSFTTIIGAILLLCYARNKGIFGTCVYVAAWVLFAPFAALVCFLTGVGMLVVVQFKE